MDYQQVINNIYHEVKSLPVVGEVADYIPALANVDPDQFGIAIATIDGQTFGIGDYQCKFSIQSISKAFTLSMVIRHIGSQLWEYVGKEPSGTPFNSLVQLERENGIGAVPVHVGIIMDGNGRWATKRGKPRSFGHAEGVKTMEKVIGYADEAGIKVLSLYVFSTENINRPEEEVSGLFSLAEKYFSRTKELVRRNYRVTVSGSVTKLPYDLVIKFREAERLTSCNTGLTVNFCFNYGGRDEIVRANADLGWFQAPGNLGFTVLGLLYGGGDFGKTLCYAVNCGDDTDCTAATAGSILGIMYGAKNIPEQWIAPIGRTIQTVAINRFELPVPGTIDELTDRVVNEALRAAQENPLLVQFSETESSVLTAADAAALATPQALEIDQWAQEFNFPWGTFTVTGEEWPLLESGVARRLKVEISHTAYVNEVVSIKPLLPEGWSATPAGVVFTPSRRTFVASAELEITPGEIDDALIYIPFEIRLAGRANPFMTAVPFQQRGAVSGNNMSRLCRARSRQLRRHQARCCR